MHGRKKMKAQPLKFIYAKYLLGFYDFQNENFESALLRVNEVKKEFADLNELDAVAVCSSVLSAIFRTLGDVNLALKESWEGYQQLKKSGEFSHNMMACGYLLGSIYVEMKNYADAVPVYTTILETAERADAVIWQINVNHGFGKIYLALKKYPEAQAYLEQAKRIAEKTQAPLLISISLTDLAVYYSETGDYKAAEELHKQSITIREQHAFVGGAITNCIKLGEIYIQQSRFDDAIDILNKGLQLGEQINVKLKNYQVHELLSEVYQAKNDFEKSLYHYKLFHKLRGEVEVEDNEKKIKNMHMMFEAEQTFKENIIIKKQKAEIEHKNIELQETIDELTLSKINRKAKALTLAIAIALFFVEDLLLDFILHKLPEDNFILSFGAKILIVFSLKPKERGIEHLLLKKVIKKKKRDVVV